MKSRNSPLNSSDGSQDTDTTLEKEPGHKVQVTWWDYLPYYNFVIPFIMLYVSWEYLNHNVFILIWFLYVVVPIVDVLLPLDNYNLSNEEVKAFEKDKRFFIPLYLYMVIDFGFYFWGIYLFATGSIDSLLDKIMFTVTVAHAGAIGMTIGHELLHRRETIHKVAGTLFYSKVMYSHFFIEHTKGHHKNVATPMDPASAMQGESLYQFLPRSILGGYKSVWKYESQRLARKPKPESAFSLNNRMISFSLAQLTYLSIITYLFGYEVLIYAVTYAMLDVFFLETINYIEHYGLRRECDENGVYEPVNIKHSWNAPQRYTNYLLFKLQRHSDHHANSYKPYQILNSFEDSPTLPNGYSASLLTSFVPSIWFKAIDPLVNAYNEDRELTKEEKETSKSTINAYLFTTGTIMTVVCYLLM